MEPEIEAMGAIAAAVAKLQPEEMRRVLKWATEKYSAKPPPANGSPASPLLATSSTEFGDFPALFDAAAPETGLERILVCAYWFQIVQGQPDIDSQSLNAELKNMGRPSGNITRDMESLINRVPKLVIQTRKEGKSKQARKRFRLTQEGIREVQRLFERKRAGAAQ